MTRMAIEARDLQLAYQRKTILNRLNLAVPEGAVLGLVGRNGAQANAKPDANQQYLEAAAQEAQAKAVKAAADTDLTKAKTLETLAKVEAANTDQALAVLDRISPAPTDVSVVAVPENPPGL